MRIFCLALFSFLLITSCNKNNQPEKSLSSFIPKNSEIIIKTNSLENFKNDLNNNAFLNEFSNLTSYKNLDRKLNWLSKTNSSSKALLCFSYKNEKTQFSFITKYHDSIFKKDAIKKIKVDTLKIKSNSIFRSIIENDTIYNMVKDSIFFATNYINIIEEVFNGDESKTESFENLYATIKDSDKTSILIQNNNELVESFTHENKINLSNFTGSLALESNISQKEIIFNGITKAKDSTQLIEVFKNTIPQDNQIAKITPSNSDGFMSFSFNDFYTFNEHLSKHQKNDSIKTETVLFENISEIGVIYEGNNQAIVLNSLDATITKDALLEEQSTIKNYRDIDIFNFSQSNIFSSTFYPFITFNEITKYCIIDNFFVFSDNMDILQNIIANYQNKTTVNQREYYKNIKTKLSDASSLMILFNSSKLKSILSKNLSEKLLIDLTNYKASAIQFIYDRNFAHVNAIVSKHKTRGAQHTISEEFQIKLDNDILNNPQFVTNHVTKQKEIVVQDIKNNLYQISNQGKILWKKQLHGAILGDIKQIDMYKNGRLQLAFATPNRIYVLDRNGKNVSPFPLKFNDEITQPLSVFDYDKNKKYRLLVTQGNNVLMFDVKGKPVKGFNFKNTNETINHQPQHFRINNKDYLAIKTKSKLYILDRTGKNRITPKTNSNFSKEAVYIYKGKFTTTTFLGDLISIDTRGNTSIKNLGLNENHSLFTTSKTLVSLSENKLTIKGRTLELDFGNYTHPEIFYLNDKIYVSVTDLQTNRTYLYDSQAKLLPNFPVYSTSKIKLDNIDNDRNLEFISKGESNNVLLYQIN